MLDKLLNVVNPLKGYLVAAGAAVLAVLVGIFKYRGYKVDKLEGTIETLEKEAKVQEETFKYKEDVSKFETANKVAAAKAEARDYDEITDSFYSI